jgi:homoserine kinase type II
MLSDLMDGGAEQLGRILRHERSSPFASQAHRMLELFPGAAARVTGRLGRACRVAVPKQPCIRDIWHDHLLFTGERVSGVVDFGALRVETVAGDIARLLGSLAGDDPQQRQQGIDAYKDLRPLSSAEQELVEVFDTSLVLLAGMNWLRWIFHEQRQFERPQAVIERLDEILLRLEHLVGTSTYP